MTRGTASPGAGSTRRATISRKYTIPYHCSNSISDLILCRKKIRPVPTSTVAAAAAATAAAAAADESEESEEDSSDDDADATVLSRIEHLEQSWGLQGSGSFSDRVKDLEKALAGVEGTGSLVSRVAVLEASLT